MAAYSKVSEVRSVYPLQGYPSDLYPIYVLKLPLIAAGKPRSAPHQGYPSDLCRRKEPVDSIAAGTPARVFGSLQMDLSSATLLYRKVSIGS